MGKQYTIKEVKTYLKGLGFELISKEYKNAQQKLIIKDNDGYTYFNSLSSIKQHNSMEKFCKSNPYTISNIKLWIKLNNKSFELISDEYKDSRQNLIFKDAKGYYYQGILVNMVNGTLKKFHKKNPYTIQNIKLWCKLNSKSFELVSGTYNGAFEYLNWKCLTDNCKETFLMSWDNIFHDHGCPFCAGKQVGLSNCLATKNPELAKEWHPTKNGDLTPWDVTCGQGKKVWWLCKNNPKHEWFSAISHRNSYNEGCPYCCSCPLPSEDYNLLVVNPALCKEWNYEKNEKRPEDYTPGSEQKVWWKCSVCNYEWLSIISNRAGINSRGCPECNKSKGEIAIQEYFDQYTKYYIDTQIEFIDLQGLGNGNLSFDFGLYGNKNKITDGIKFLIEYDGEYHYVPIKKYKNEDISKAKERLKKQQYHDKLKNNYCMKHHISLIRIPYWEFKNIKTILDDVLLFNNVKSKFIINNINS